MKKLLKTAIVAGGVLCAVKGLDNRLELTHYKIKSEKIPKEFNGFKIVQISDIHSDNISGLVPEIESEKPDIIVSTGDIVHDKGRYDNAVRLSRRLSKIAPVYSVTGNHDVWRGDWGEVEKKLCEAGVVTLHNECIEIERNGERIGLSGIDDPFAVMSDGIKTFLDKAINSIEKYDGFNILLFHRANWLDYFKDKGFDLIVSGHMHGGQMRLPFLGGVMSPRSSWSAGNKILFPKYVGGSYSYGDTALIVSRGLGNPMIIPRVFNRPELVTITLYNK